MIGGEWKINDFITPEAFADEPCCDYQMVGEGTLSVPPFVKYAAYFIWWRKFT